MSYVKKTIQPYFTWKQFSTSSNNNQVTKDKLVQLWFEDKKKATISIIDNKSYWPETVHPEIDKKKTEEYYRNKYNHFRSNLNR